MDGVKTDGTVDVSREVLAASRAASAEAKDSPLMLKVGVAPTRIERVGACHLDSDSVGSIRPEPKV